MDLVQLLQFVLIASSGVYAQDDAGHVVQGPLHEALETTMKTCPHVRKITLGSPRKIMRRGTCKWVMTGETLGEYGLGFSFLTMKAKACDRYTKASWDSVFPCAITKQPLRTTCQGPLPEGAENAEWTMSSMNIDVPTLWDGVVPPAPQTPLAKPVSFNNTLDCNGLGGLLLAKLIQQTGLYRGQGTVTCQHTKTFIYIMVQAPGVDGYLRLDSSSETLAGDPPKTKPVSWDSGLNVANELVVITNVDDGEHMTVSYNKDDLTNNFVTVDGKVHRYQYGNMSPLDKGEPRLCPASAMSSSCAIMSGLSTCWVT